MGCPHLTKNNRECKNGGNVEYRYHEGWITASYWYGRCASKSTYEKCPYYSKGSSFCTSCGGATDGKAFCGSCGAKQ